METLLPPLPINKVVRGYAVQEMRKMPSKSVNLGITSTPYYEQRYYNTDPQVWDENPLVVCEHDWVEKKKKLHSGRGDAQQGGKYSEQEPIPDLVISTWTCSKCSAWKGELGQEPTLNDFLRHLVEIFREFKRILRDDGTLWVNIGDKRLSGNRWALTPARLAIMMEEDGWRPAMQIVWHKPNPVPMSSPTMFKPDFEWFLVFSKKPKFYLDKNAVKKPLAAITEKRNKYPVGTFKSFGQGLHSRNSSDAVIFQPSVGGSKHAGHNTNAAYSGNEVKVTDGKAHLGSVWSISTQSRFKSEYCPTCDALRKPADMFKRCEKCKTPYGKKDKNCPACGWKIKEPCCKICKNKVHSHYAMFPEPLIEPIIKSASPERVCAICGAPSIRIYNEKRIDTRPGNDTGNAKSGSQQDPHQGLHNSNLSSKRQMIIHTPTDEFQDSCNCSNKTYQKAVVLDMCGGFGTTGAVAAKHGRNFVLIEPLKDNARAAELRCQYIIEQQKLGESI